MGDYIPKFAHGDAVTFTASADIIGGRLVEVTGPREVAQAGADSAKVTGVAARDVKAGEKVLVHPPGHHRLVAAGVIAAGDRIVSAAGGKISAHVADGAGATKNPLGLAVTASAKADDVVEARI